MDLFLAILSLILGAQSAYSTMLMLYVWEDRLKSRRNRAPRTFESPRQRFTLLLPARHEEDVIQDTIQRVVDFRYPREEPVKDRRGDDVIANELAPAHRMRRSW